MRLSLATPMIGGGADAGKVDVLWPIRPSSIRGQLRWWWRASFAGEFRSVEAMRDAESAIFGGRVTQSTDSGERDSLKEGALSITVNVQPQKTVHEVPPRPDKEAYPTADAFEAAKRSQEDAAKRMDKLIPPYAWRLLESITALEVATFEAVLTYDPAELTEDQFRQIQVASLLWASFGGVGARTRRGCGSLLLTEKGRPPTATVQKILKVAKQPPFDIPTLYNARLLLGDERDSPKEAWQDALDVIEAFRKGYEGNSQAFSTFKRERGTPAAAKGHTPWPEADMIRRKDGNTDLDDPDRLEWDTHAVPRARLGLPIISRFQQLSADRRPAFGYVPGQFTVSGGSVASRLASPILARPIKVDGNKWQGMLLVLNSPILDDADLQIESKPARRQGRNWVIRGLDTSAQSAPYLGVGEFDDMLDLFVAYAEGLGWT